MASADRLLIVDGSCDGLIAWSPFREAVEACGVEVEYAAIDRVLAGDVSLDGVAHAFFVASTGVLHAGAASRAFLDLLARAERCLPGTLGVFVPSSAEVLRVVLEAVDATSLAPHVGPWLAHPLGDHPLRDSYDTTLLPPRRPSISTRSLADATLARVGPRASGRGARARLVVGRSEVLGFAGPSESFHLMPLDPARAGELRAAAYAEVARWLGRAVRPAPPPRPLLPLERSMWRKTAWLELTAFETGDEPRIIDACVRARLDAVWISIAPNRYCRPGARFFARQAAMLASVERFTAALARATPTPPALLVAVHPADNFTCPPLPERPARDVYGRVYEDVPAPLDRAFWRDEVELPMAWFAREWAARAQLPLAGVVLDLELYLRKRSGLSYWAGELVDEAGGDLEARAAVLGASVGASLRQHVPAVAVYMATLHTGWFFRGFFAGLAEPGRALPVFSFKVAYEGSPYPVPIAHASVVMLSKLRRVEDAARVAQVLERNHGVWLNRLSRVEPYDPTAWHAVEQTPLGEEDRRRLWDRVGEV